MMFSPRKKLFDVRVMVGRRLVVFRMNVQDLAGIFG